MGRHQPRTNRSFYLSVAASTLRFAIIVALVVGGVVLINQAFDVPSSQGSGAIGDDGGLPTQTESPSPSASPSESESPREEPSPTVTGTVVAVFNGTGVTGLAGDTLTELIDQYGYEQGQEPADAPSLMDVTTIYYAKARDKVEAEFLAQDFFRRLDVEVTKLPAGEEVDSSVQLAIYLGQDYADVA
jgi:hypothetical protein